MPPKDKRVQGDVGPQPEGGEGERDEGGGGQTLRRRAWAGSTTGG